MTFQAIFFKSWICMSSSSYNLYYLYSESLIDVDLSKYNWDISGVKTTTFLTSHPPIKRVCSFSYCRLPMLNFMWSVYKLICSYNQNESWMNWPVTNDLTTISIVTIPEFIQKKKQDKECFSNQNLAGIFLLTFVCLFTIFIALSRYLSM